RVVNIRALRQIDLRLAHMQEAQRISFGEFARLGGGHHVVGQFANLVGEFGLRAERREWFNLGHTKISVFSFQYSKIVLVAGNESGNSPKVRAELQARSYGKWGRIRRERLRVRSGLRLRGPGGF